MRKLRPDSNQSQLTPEETERLLEACRTMGYREAVEWANANLGVETTTASLCRWYQAQSAGLTSGRLRAALKASEDFDAQLDTANLAAREANALRAAYWDASNSGDIAAMERLGSLILEYVKADRAFTETGLKQRRIAQYEDAARLAREKFEAAERRLSEAKAVVMNEALTDEQRMEKIRGIFAP